MTEGSLLHALLLGDADSIAIIDVKDWRTKAAKVWKAATIANGVSPVLKHEHDAALVLAERLRDKFLERGYDIREFAHEVTIVWDETASDGTKVRCRGRVDALDLETARVLDLKSTASAGATGIAKSCISYGYDVQHAAYVSAIETLRPELAGRVEYDWLFFETTPPYAVTPATPDGTMRELGESKWRRAVEIWAHCLRSATWPEYTAEKIFVPAPMWALRQELGTDAAEY
jgi:hypothetical protein